MDPTETSSPTPDRRSGDICSLIEIPGEDGPCIEIRQRGQPFPEPVTQDAGGFRLDLLQARMLLACMRELRLFVASKGDRPAAGTSLPVRSCLWRCAFDVVRHTGHRVDGEWVWQPCLLLQGQGTAMTLNLPMTEAVLQLEAEIERFVLAHL